MAATGAPNQKYAASDEPDLVNGPYAEHTHEVEFDLPGAGLPVTNNTKFIAYSDLEGYQTNDATELWTYISARADNRYLSMPSSGSVALLSTLPFIDSNAEMRKGSPPDVLAKAISFAGSHSIPSSGYVTLVDMSGAQPQLASVFISTLRNDFAEYANSQVPVYTENLSNVTPIGVQTSALDSPKGIVSHDLHVVLTHYPPMAGDAGETEIVVPRLVGHLEVDGTLGGGGGAVSPNARYLQITFDNFPTDATNYGSSNVAVVTSGSNPTYLGTCFVPMTLGSTLSNAVIVSLPTVGDSGTLASPTIYFS